MRISHYQLRTLIESVILEGFQNDQQYLAEKYPEHSQDIFRLQPKWISWLMARFGESPTQKEIHPLSDAIVTVLNFSKKDAAIGEKWKSNEQFRNAINDHFPEGERAWRSPADAMTMTVDQMELILGLAERKKQKIELKDENFESDRVGKVGPWNIWLPTTRENSCKIAGYDPVTMKPKTTWCTARTSGSNLFYNYTGRSGHEITLFYIIKDNPTTDTDWLSLGFVNGKPDLSGARGGLSVDRANNGLTASHLTSILESYHDEIMNMMESKNKSLGGKHPAREKIVAAAQSVEALNYLLKGLSKDEATDMKKLVIAEPDLCVDVIRIFAADSNSNIKSSVAMHKNVPQDVLFKLANDDDQNVRSAVARNQNLPQDILRKLATDHDTNVRVEVTYHENLTADLLRILAKDSDWKVRSKAAINKNISLNNLYELAKDAKVEVREQVAANRKTPDDILRKLAEDKKWEVRINIARNQNSPQDILDKLAEDPNPSVVKWVPLNRNTSADTLRKLALNSENIIRKRVAINTNTPLDILDMLSKDSYFRTRSSVAQNPNTSIDTLRKLANDANIDVKIGVAINTNTPLDILNILAKSSSDKLRSHVVQNPSINQEMLRMFTNDVNKYIREYAINKMQAQL